MAVGKLEENIRVLLQMEEALNLIFMQKIKKERYRYMISKCKELIQEQMSIGQDFIVVC